MNSEDTIIMQPKNNVEKAAESNKVKEQEQNTTANAPKDEKSSNNHTAGKVAATAAAGVFGGAAGGAASIAAANLMDSPEDEPVVEPVEEEVVVAAKPEPKSEPEPKEEEQKEEEPITGGDDGSDDQDGQEGGDDYTGNGNQDLPVPPTGQEPVTPTPTSDGPAEPEIQVLGVYERYDENGVHQEMAILTDGEKIAAVLDGDGDGNADILAVDENMNGHFEEGEIHYVSDIADHPVEMSQYEEAYIAQQEAQQFEEQPEAYTCETSDESDFNNDVDFSMA